MDWTYLSRSHLVKERDVLPENRLEVTLANTTSRRLARVNPRKHVEIRRDEGAKSDVAQDGDVLVDLAEEDRFGGGEYGGVGSFGETGAV